MSFYIYIWTVLSILTTMTHGAPPLEQRHELVNPSQRHKRQFFSNVFAADSNQLSFPADNNIGVNPFTRPQRRRPGPGQPLIFSNDGRQTIGSITSPQPASTQSLNGQQINNTSDANVVFINNRPAVATIAPFTAPTTASPRFLNCFASCPTTSEYNPVCASNQQQYHNQQKFDCARICGAIFVSACLAHHVHGLPQAGRNWSHSRLNATAYSNRGQQKYQPTVVANNSSVQHQQWQRGNATRVSLGGERPWLNNNQSHPYIQVPGLGNSPNFAAYKQASRSSYQPEGERLWLNNNQSHPYIQVPGPR